MPATRIPGNDPTARPRVPRDDIPPPGPDGEPAGDDDPIERDVAQNETKRQGPESERALDEPVTRFPAG